MTHRTRVPDATDSASAPTDLHLQAAADGRCTRRGRSVLHSNKLATGHTHRSLGQRPRKTSHQHLAEGHT